MRYCFALTFLSVWTGMVGMALGEGNEICLSQDGRSRCCIVVAQDAIWPERTAAMELQCHLEQVTGGSIPVVLEKGPLSFPVRLFVGESETLAKSFPNLDLRTLGEDGIVFKTKNQDIFLAGGRPRGTLYAVFTFLEDVVGCRWWTSTESTLPDRPSLNIPIPLDRLYVPPLQYREAFYKDALNAPFAARCRCNGHFAKTTEAFGGHHRLLGWCHTFFGLLPPEEYFEEHPDWYSEVDGGRIRNGQLCLTNEAMRKELTEKALERIRVAPDAGFISISQNDWERRCQCEKCLAIEAEEGSPSGPLIRFVNKVAESIEEEFPDIWVETLAYSYTRKPPQHARPRKNVVVRLCSIECSFVQPLATGPQNVSFREDIEAWSRISPQLYIWDYVANFKNFLFPHPNLRVLAPNIRFFLNQGALGIFEQGDAWCDAGDLAPLRAWVISHLLWDPTLDDRALIREFLEGYYGPAADALQEYIDLSHDLAEDSGVYLKCFTRSTLGWLGEEDLLRLTEIFKEAEAAVADDPVLKERVLKARTGLDFAWIMSCKRLWLEAQLRGERFRGPQDPRSFAQAFVDRMKSFGVTHYREGRPFDDWAFELVHNFAPLAPPPSDVEVEDSITVDVQEGEFVLEGEGTQVVLCDDPLALDGRAALLKGNHKERAAQYHPDDSLRGTGPWRVYLICRYEGTAAEGDICRVGIYDEEVEKMTMSRTLTAEEVGKQDYAAVDLGSMDLCDDFHFWIAPLDKGDQVRRIWVDRFFLVKKR